MSRYEVESRNPQQVVVHVGYDTGVDSLYFYAAKKLVTDKTKKPIGENNGHVIEYMGTRAGEIPSVERLIEVVEPYAVLDDFVIKALRDDLARAHQASPKQLDIVQAKGG